MHTLDLYKPRRFTEVKLSDGQTYKIPNEYTVEEVERLLELKSEEENMKELPVGETKAIQEEQLKSFWNNIFSQLEIIFQSFQPDMNEAYLKNHVTHNEALEIVGFFQKYRALAVKQIIDEEATDVADSKKKLKN